MTAPANPPKMIRTANTGVAVRGGVLGSLSLTSSATARMLRITTVTMFPIHDAQVWLRLIQFRKAAQATAAGAVTDRKPATTPINRANSRTRTCVTAIPPGTDEQPRQSALADANTAIAGPHGQNRQNLMSEARIAFAPIAASSS